MYFPEQTPDSMVSLLAVFGLLTGESGLSDRECGRGKYKSDKGIRVLYLFSRSFNGVASIRTQRERPVEENVKCHSAA